MQKIDILLGLGLVLISAGIGMNYLRAKQPETRVELVRGVAERAEVVVEVAGEVFKPGVYRLAGGSRINEALAEAGGLTAKADRDWVERNINQAEVLSDGQKIVIPSVEWKSEIKDEKEIILGVEEALVNINTAGVEEWDKLPGIGPALGQRIIDYRQKNGRFKDINEIKLVSGIGEKLFEKIKYKISL